MKRHCLCGLCSVLLTAGATAITASAQAAKARADVYLSIHPYYDKTLDKIHALNFRKPGGPHPFVSRDAVQRFLTVMAECTDPQLARVTSE